MKIAIYQINLKRDYNKVSCLGYDKLRDKNIDSKIYDKVFEGDVLCENLEDVFELFNWNHPKNFQGHSLSISDIVEVISDTKIEKGYYFCDSIGFKKIKFNTCITK